MPHPHPQSASVINRLARIEGHVRAVKVMAESGKPCADILHQLSAIEAAIRQTARLVMEDHLDRCLLTAVQEDPAETRDLVEGIKSAFASYLR